ncbi:unnamed protein product, partial [Ectocarpus sp. 12 AP-2014]
GPGSSEAAADAASAQVVELLPGPTGDGVRDAHTPGPPAPPERPGQGSDPPPDPRGGVTPGSHPVTFSTNNSGRRNICGTEDVRRRISPRVQTRIRLPGEGFQRPRLDMGGDNEGTDGTFPQNRLQTFEEQQPQSEES